jgi:serine/threonine protein kinase/Leucine-rich repeat (LRR) protein
MSSDPADSVADMPTIAVAKPVPAPLPEVAVMGADPDSSVPFVFGRQIAKGGMGAILEGDDCKLGRKIAVKVMLDPRADSEQTRRFVQEAAVLGRLEHPNIVPIHDLGRDSEGALYYTMKLVKGRTLQHIIDDLRRENKEALAHYTLDRLLTIFRKVCDALAFAHASHIIHRDLKPENVMVGEFGEVLVMDWGIAKILDGKADTPVRSDSDQRSGEESPRSSTASLTATMDGAVMGTPNYMSPEQAMGKVNELDERSDIFSLGGILYAILTLRPPVEGKDVWEVLEKVSTAEIADPTTFGSTTGKGQPQEKGNIVAASSIKPLPHLKGGRVPSALSAVAMKALSLDKAERYQKISTFSEDIEAYQGGFATSAEQASAWTQLQLFIKRHRAATVGAALVLLVGGVLGAKALVEGRRAERTLTELRGTAPLFAAQSRILLSEGKIDEALEKIGYAVKLRPDSPDYLLDRAHLLQSTQNLSEAAAAYSLVLALRSSDESAKLNLELCGKLMADKGAATKLPLSAENRLLDALIAQKRHLEAAPLSAKLNRNSETARATVLAKLSQFTRQQSWNGNRLQQKGETFELNLSNLEIGDLTALRGLPISKLNIVSAPVSDLSPLAGMLLEELEAQYTNVSDLSPLRGMKLRRLNLARTRVQDISPLAGMPLRSLVLEGLGLSDLSVLKGMPLNTLSVQSNRGVSDLSPVSDAPLEYLIMGFTGVSDIKPLQRMPLKTLSMDFSQVQDFSPLRGHPTLERISLPFGVTDIEFLDTLPRLREVSLQPYGSARSEPFTTTAFYARYGKRTPVLKDAWNAIAAMGLKEMPVRSVELHPQRGLMLHLYSSSASIEDLRPLRELPISHLGISGNPCPLRDLSPLRGMPIKTLNIPNIMGGDITPLLDCTELEELFMTNPFVFPGFQKLRGHPRLRRISTRFENGHPAQTAEEFWKEYDAKQAAGKK